MLYQPVLDKGTVRLCVRPFYAMKEQHNFQVNTLEYLEEAMPLYSMYSATSIDEILDTSNHPHKTLSQHEEILSVKQSHWYKNQVLERRISHMVFSSLLYLHELQVKYVNTYKDWISKLYSHINVINIFSTDCLPNNLILPSQLDWSTTQVKKAFLKNLPWIWFSN